MLLATLVGSLTKSFPLIARQLIFMFHLPMPVQALFFIILAENWFTAVSCVHIVFVFSAINMTAAVERIK